MYNYYITTDQTADFPQELVKDDFKILLMSYNINGVLYDGIETPFLPSHEFYTMLSAGIESKTSMVTLAHATDVFKEILDAGHDILHIAFSSALSGNYNSSFKAAETLRPLYPNRKIEVVDSKCCSAGEAMLVYYAMKKRDEGMSIEDNAAYATELREHIGHSFTVNDMYHLYRGGRVSRGTAIVGNAINIKPVLMVNEKGELIPIGSVMGRKKALRALVDKMEVKGKNYTNDIITISHGDCLEDALALKKLVNERFGEQKVIITEVGAVIGSHCGKGVLALFYLSNDKFTNKN
ncbi:MAG: DegV family protein [Clostridia bacterium]